MNTIPLIETARAKLNLTLHVGPLSPDGYHPLKSLVVFADIGDEVELRPAAGKDSTLMIDGPFAGGLVSDSTNLILRAAAICSDNPFDFKLTKKLPIASGIGGGSADAAATVRLISLVTKRGVDRRAQSLLDLGADIPVCVESDTCWMQGRGEELTPLPGMGTLHAVLVNPGVAVATGKIFTRFDDTNPDCDHLINDLSPTAGLLAMALAGHNDLQDIAISLVPEISTVLGNLRAQLDCQLARMSGSGATCFGLFPSAAAAQLAQKQISDQYPDWWCVQSVLGDMV